eukprot:3289972-Pyramimonas_sp.AAC.1
MHNWDDQGKKHNRGGNGMRVAKGRGMDGVGARLRAGLVQVFRARLLGPLPLGVLIYLLVDPHALQAARVERRFDLPELLEPRGRGSHLLLLVTVGA